ncbi:MAG: nucleotidyltransferase family protein [Candidatus Omnitrophota bacterium]
MSEINRLIVKLRELKLLIEERFKAENIELFGSMVRGEEKENSDIDLLVDFKEGADFFDLVGLSVFLEEEFQRKVDVVSRRALREELRESISKEAVPI